MCLSLASITLAHVGLVLFMFPSQRLRMSLILANVLQQHTVRAAAPQSNPYVWTGQLSDGSLGRTRTNGPACRGLGPARDWRSRMSGTQYLRWPRQTCWFAT